MTKNIEEVSLLRFCLEFILMVMPFLVISTVVIGAIIVHMLLSRPDNIEKHPLFKGQEEIIISRNI